MKSRKASYMFHEHSVIPIHEFFIENFLVASDNKWSSRYVRRPSRIYKRKNWHTGNGAFAAVPPSGVRGCPQLGRWRSSY